MTPQVERPWFLEVDWFDMVGRYSVGVLSREEAGLFLTSKTLCQDPERMTGVILMTLHAYADDDGIARLTKGDVAAILHMEPFRVKRALRALQRAGFLVRAVDGYRPFLPNDPDPEREALLAEVPR